MSVSFYVLSLLFLPHSQILTTVETCNEGGCDEYDGGEEAALPEAEDINDQEENFPVTNEICYYIFGKPIFTATTLTSFSVFRRGSRLAITPASLNGE